uniref:Uncharacterized protein n=1 Tax=Myotis myotis TaxID=51298 RepID=A0A7J7TIK7_MYOMY|nr:hypothetical protein mMyoMyo1_009087 [Myotis myotis]
MVSHYTRKTVLVLFFPFERYGSSSLEKLKGLPKVTQQVSHWRNGWLMLQYRNLDSNLLSFSLGTRQENDCTTCHSASMTTKDINHPLEPKLYLPLDQGITLLQHSIPASLHQAMMLEISMPTCYLSY